MLANIGNMFSDASSQLVVTMKSRGAGSAGTDGLGLLNVPFVCADPRLVSALTYVVSDKVKHNPIKEQCFIKQS